MKARKTQKLLLATLGILLLVLVGGLWLGNKALSTKSRTLAQTKAKADASQSEYQTLLETKVQIKRLGNLSQLVDQILPTSNNQSLVIAEITQIAHNAGINLSSVTFPDAAMAASSSTDSGAKSSSAIAQVKGVSAVPLTLQAGNMSYNQLLQFLQSIEQNRRLMQPTSVIIQPGAGGSISSLGLNLDLYVRGRGSK